MVAKLEKRLATQPNDPEGWARLGRSYVVLERKDEALAAYAKAYQLAPDNVAVLSDYAWLLFNESPGVTTGLVQKLYNHLYILEPAHPDALWFLGFSAYQQGDFRTALVMWERLIKLLPAEDPGREQLKQAITSAREKQRR
jgi:cytochrome c-type biogenesis protein CcmH